MKKRKPWVLLLLIPFAGSLAWFLDPSQPNRVVDEIQEASDRRDLDAVRARFHRAMQTGWRGKWQLTTPKLVAQELGWNETRRYEGPPLRYERRQYIDWQDPGHRYVVIRTLDSMPDATIIRLRWVGTGWKVDGSWGHGCLVVEEESKEWRRWIRVG